MDFEYFSARAMEPGDHNDFVARLHSMKTAEVCRGDLQQGIGRTLVGVKQRGILPALDFRSNHANRLKRKSTHAPPPSTIFLISTTSAMLSTLILARAQLVREKICLRPGPFSRAQFPASIPTKIGKIKSGHPWAT